LFFRPRARFLTYLKRLWCTSLAPFGWIRLGDKVPLKPSSGLHVAWNLDPLHVISCDGDMIDMCLDMSLIRHAAFQKPGETSGQARTLLWMTT
jgi:hypothetical protein